MPELPEVETIRTQLEQFLPLKLKEANFSPLSRNLIKRQDFRLSGQETITRIDRRAKYLFFHFNHSRIMVSHLGMSGNWRISKTPLQEKHLHLQLLGEKHSFSYIDPRRFGHLYFFEKKLLQEFLQKKSLLFDVAHEEFTAEIILERLQRYPKRLFKLALMDQQLFPGIGNYMASEICALAHLHPEALCQHLNLKNAKDIHQAIQKVIKGQIAHQGLSFHGGYRDAFGADGGGLSNLVVFHQKICGMCGKSSIQKVILGGRSTFFCQSCQPRRVDSP